MFIILSFQVFSFFNLGVYSPGSASNSLAMLSQKHAVPNTDNCNLPNITNDSHLLSFRKGNSQSYINKKRLNTIHQNDTKGKNWNFVPISTATNSSEIFASPRSTPVIRKNLISKQIDQQISQGNIDSASAPPSPSIQPGQMKFVSNGNITISEHQSFSPYGNHEQIKQQFATDSEGRSQSVPLHYKNNSNSPIFINTNYNEYSSACNSITHTPVPHEFNDFEIFSDEATQQQNAMTVTSRSVPSTPLINNVKNQKGLFQIKEGGHHMMNNNDGKMSLTAKSMPTTPISSRGIISNIFRYSPDFNRDSLINGNTYCNNDSFDGVNSILPNTPMDTITNSSLSGEIEELEQFGNVDDMF